MWVVSLVAFFMSHHVPQDPVIALMQSKGLMVGEQDMQINAKGYEDLYKELGRDKPLFYFSILPHHYPSNINIHSSERLKSHLIKLLSNGYGYAESLALLLATDTIYRQAREDKTLLVPILQGEQVGVQVEAFYRSHDVKDLASLSQLDNNRRLLDASHNAFFWPRLYWHGTQNQYHQWLREAIRGRFGISFMHNKEASSLVKKALIWTGALSLLDILFSFVIGIAAAYFMAKNPTGFKEKTLSQALYFLYAMPVFWLATLCVIYFTTDDYGTWTNIFPSVGINIYPEVGPIKQVLYNAPKLILPVLIMSIGTITFIAKMLTQSLHNEMAKPYILTAYAKGLTPSQALKKHALPNALLPLITILAGALPRSLAGAVVIEVIFNLPGVGRLMYESIGSADWNVVFCIMMFLAVVTMLSYLVGDLLYAFVNPKIKYA